MLVVVTVYYPGSLPDLYDPPLDLPREEGDGVVSANGIALAGVLAEKLRWRGPAAQTGVHSAIQVSLTVS
jgi:hypothetical protein